MRYKVSIFFAVVSYLRDHDDAMNQAGFRTLALPYEMKNPSTAMFALAGFTQSSCGQYPQSQPQTPLEDDRD